MKNLRSKLILAFIIIIIISVVSFGLPLIWYNLVISGIIDNIGRNNERMNGIQEIKGLIFEEQRILADSIVNSDTSRADELKKINESISKNIDKLSDAAELKKLKEEDINELKRLKELNKSYLEAYKTGVLSGIVQEDREKLYGSFKLLAEDYKRILEIEQKLKDSISSRADMRVKELISYLEQSRDLTAVQYSGLLGLADQLQNVKAEVERIGLNEEFGKLEKRIEEALETGRTVVELNAGISFEEVRKDLFTLDNINRLIYWTQKEYYSRAESIIFLDDKPESAIECGEKADGYIKQLMLLVPLQYRKSVEDIASVNTVMDMSFNDIVSVMNTIKGSKIKQSYENSSQTLESSWRSINTLNDSLDQYLADDIDTSEKTKKDLIMHLAGMAVLSLVIGMLIALLISRNITLPIKSMIGLLSRAEKGDLTVRTLSDRKDEIGVLGSKVNNILDGHQKVVDQVMIAAEEISSFRQRFYEISSSSRDNTSSAYDKFKDTFKNVKGSVPGLSESIAGISRLSEEAWNVYETSSKIMDDGMKAAEAAFAGERTVEEAERVIKRVTDTVQKIEGTINQLDESSGKIGDITNTITDIASKTNLLALNAAIEAAKAGQQGKGFTVLADEIRKLSERSNKAATEIKALIAEIQGRVKVVVENINGGVTGVEEGVTKIDKVKENIYQVAGLTKIIVESVKSTGEAIRLHADSSRELTGIIDSVTKTAHEAVAAGEGVDESLLRQKSMAEEMDVLSLKLDEAYNNLNSLLQRFTSLG